MKRALSVFGATLKNWLALLCLSSLALGAHAAQVLVLMDTDNNAMTGCTVVAGGESFAGVETILTTDVNPVTSPPTVTSVAQQNCVTPATNTFGPPAAVSTGGWMIGAGQGVGGGDVIETYFPPAIPFGTYRLGFVYTDSQSGSDVLFTRTGAAGGPAILYAFGEPPGVVPALSRLGLLLLALGLSACAFVVLRRYKAPLLIVVAVVSMVVASSTWAAIVLDGMIADWTGINPIATDTAGDAPAGSDLTAVFAKAEIAAGRMYFRADVKLRSAQTINFTSTAPAAAAVGGATYTVTATGGASGNPVTFAIDASASSVCSIAGSTVSFAGVGTCVINANQAGNASYNAAPQVQQSFAVGKGSQTISFTSTAPVGATVGGATYAVTATATSGLAVSLAIDASASAVCSISGSTVSFTGVGNCVINANQAGNASYNAAPQLQQTFAVSMGSQTISFTSTAPAAAAVGGATYTVAATATSGLAVSLAIDASAGSVCSIAGSTVSFTGVGTCVINANQAGNASYNAAPQLQQSFAVGKGSQTISFTSTAPVGATVGGATYTVTATATSGLTVSLAIDASASTVCSISGSTVSFIGAGTCVINANQAGNASYNAAPQLQQTFAVGKASQTISFTSSAPAGATVGGATYAVTATATSGLTVSLAIDASASAVCSISGSTVSFTGVGNCVINANQAGNASYSAATQVQQTFAVAKGSQTISFTSSAPVGAAVGGATYAVTATATSGLTVSLAIDASASAVCSISGSTVSFTGVGNCVINANQAGNASYNAAMQVQQTFAVAKGSQTISFTSSAPAATFGGATYTVTATATSGLTVNFAIDASASSVCSISGSTVSFVGAGTCVINANQTGNSNYNAATQVQQTFAVAKANQTISFTSTAPAAASVGGATYTVTATATSGLTVSFTIAASASSICSISGSTVSFIGAGNCVINANQVGNTNYNAAPQVQQPFAVKGTQTITFTSTVPTAAVYTGTTYTVAATGGASGNAVTFTIDASASAVCSISGTTVSFTGTGTCKINANQAGSTFYEPASQVQQTFTVGPKLVGDSYTAVGNTQLVITGYTPLPSASEPYMTSTTGILANDTSDTTITLTTVSGAATTAGGLITIDSTGKFIYTPPVGKASGTDTYVYTGTSNSVSRTATITFNFSAIVWYVNSASAAATHDGRSNTPFLNMGTGANGLGTALSGAGPAAGAYIYVHQGVSPLQATTGAYTLKANQTLIGARATLTVPTVPPGGPTFTIPGNALTMPTLSGTLSANGASGLTVDGVGMSTGSLTAINLQNSDGNFTFRSVTTNGAPSGIVWNNAINATGLLKVTGDGTTNTCKTGTAACSGGMIQNSTGDGIALTRAKVDLALMLIGNNANSGIKGTSVKGFKATDILVRNNPNAAGEQAGILLNDLADTAASITRADVSGSTEDNVRVHNSTATGTITISDSTIKNNSVTLGNTGVFFQTTGTATLTGTVQNSTLSGNAAIALRGDSAESSVLSAIFTGNTITAGSPNVGNLGIVVSRAGASGLDFNIANNIVSGLPSTLVNVFSGSGPGTGVGTVQGNTLTGIGIGGNQIGIRVLNSGSSALGFGTLNVNVKNNTVSNIDLAYGILGEASGATGTGGLLKLAVTGNTVNVVAGGNAADAIRVQERHTSTVCAKISGNTTNAGGPTFYGLQLRHSPTTTAAFNLEGLTSGAQSDPTVHDFLAAQNPGVASVGPLIGSPITGVATGSCGITP